MVNRKLIVVLFLIASCTAISHPLTSSNGYARLDSFSESETSSFRASSILPTNVRPSTLSATVHASEGEGNSRKVLGISIVIWRTLSDQTKWSTIQKWHAIKDQKVKPSSRARSCKKSGAKRKLNIRPVFDIRKNVWNRLSDESQLKVRAKWSSMKQQFVEPESPSSCTAARRKLRRPYPACSSTNDQAVKRFAEFVYDVFKSERKNSERERCEKDKKEEKNKKQEKNKKKSESRRKSKGSLRKTIDKAKKACKRRGCKKIAKKAGKIGLKGAKKAGLKAIPGVNAASTVYDVAKFGFNRLPEPTQKKVKNKVKSNKVYKKVHNTKEKAKEKAKEFIKNPFKRRRD